MDLISGRIRYFASEAINLFAFFVFFFTIRVQIKVVRLVRLLSSNFKTVSLIRRSFTQETLIHYLFCFHFLAEGTLASQKIACVN